MKASEMLDVVMEYHFNVCECGCGGDSYAAESWAEMCEAYDKALADFNALCNTLGIENDLEN